MNLPNPTTLQPLTPGDCTAPTNPIVQITCGLNTLDGFSTLAPPISENSDTLGAVDAGDARRRASLGTSSVGLVPVATQRTGGANRRRPRSRRASTASRAPTTSGSPQVSPQQLQWKLDAPLDEQTTYLAYVTDGVQGRRGQAARRQPGLRAAAPRRTRSSTARTARYRASSPTHRLQQLEPLRAAMKPALDALEQAGVPRTSARARVRVHDAVRIDRARSALRIPDGLAQTLPDSPLYLVDATTQYQGIASAEGIPFNAIGTVSSGPSSRPWRRPGRAGRSTRRIRASTRSRSFSTCRRRGAPRPATRSRSSPRLHALAERLDRARERARDPPAKRSSRSTSSITASGRRAPARRRRRCSRPTTRRAPIPATQKCDEDPLVGRCVVAQHRRAAPACTPAPRRRRRRSARAR